MGVICWWHPVFTVAAWIVYSAVLGLLLFFFFCYFLRRNSKSNFEKPKSFRNFKKSNISVAKLNEDRSKLPTFYPNGWFAVAESSSLANGEIKSIFALGRELVVFRRSNKITDGQTAFVLDAHCPHLGAHFGAGGRVTGDCITCPFHGWVFDGRSGQCVAVPYAKKVPDFIQARCWSTCEKNGFIFVWYHADNKKPLWLLPEIPEIRSEKWMYSGRKQHVAYCHIQDIAENGADLHHLHQIHSDSVLKGASIGPTEKERVWKRWLSSSSFLRHEWSSSWLPPTDDSLTPHIATVQMKLSTKLFGMDCTWFNVELKIKQIGPAVVHMRWQSSRGDKGVFVQCVTPWNSPLQQRIVHRLYVSASMPWLLAKLYLHVLSVMVERDIAIWNNKEFLPQPKWIAEDVQIVRFRRWFSQFYSSKENRCSVDW